MALYAQAPDDGEDASRKRCDAEARLERIKRMYEWGDLTEEAYLTERRRVRADLEPLEGSTDWTTVLAQAASFLRDLPAAWEVATPDQRNALGRTVFQSVEITDGRVTAVVPQREFAPIFNLAGIEPNNAGNDERQPILAAPDRQVSTLAGGSDGDRSRACVMDSPTSWSSPRPRRAA